MATNKQIGDLIGDYERAFRHLQQAHAILLEAEPVASDVLGRVGPDNPSMVISSLADVISSLFLARCRIPGVTPQKGDT